MTRQIGVVIHVTVSFGFLRLFRDIVEIIGHILHFERVHSY